MSSPIVIFIVVTTVLLFGCLMFGHVQSTIRERNEVKLIRVYSKLLEDAKLLPSYECIFDASALSEKGLQAYYLSRQDLCKQTSVAIGVVLDKWHNQHLGKLFKITYQNKVHVFNAYGRDERIVKGKLAKVTYFDSCTPIKIEVEAG